MAAQQMEKQGKTGDFARTKQGFPVWDHAFAVYPPGSFPAATGDAVGLTDDQWRAAEQALRDGFVLGNIVSADNFNETAQVVSEIVERMPFAVDVACDQDQNIIFVRRRDSGETKAQPIAGRACCDTLAEVLGALGSRRPSE